MARSDEVQEGGGLSLDLGLTAVGGKWIDRTPENLRIGAVRLHSWDIHPVTPLPKDYAGYDGYAIRVSYEWGLDPGKPKPLWLEIGLDIAGAVVLDAVPRTVLESAPAKSYVLNQSLVFVPGNGGSAGLIQQPEAEPIIDVFGIGSSCVRWRHSRELPVPLRPGSRTAWLMVVVPAGTGSATVKVSARYELAGDQRANHWTGVPEGGFELVLLPGGGTTAGAGQPRRDVLPSISPAPREQWPRMKIVGGAPRLFICYAYDDLAHTESVRAFGNFLCWCGIDTQLDVWNLRARQDWYRWGTQQILDAD